MSRYRYATGSPVEEIAFRYANDRPPVALVEAARQADDGQLRTIRRALEAQGWQCVPVEDKGKEALQVSGFKDEGQLAALLHVQDFAKGAPHIEAEPGDKPSRSWKEWVEDSSMKAAGVGYLVGDGALLMSGLLSGRGKEITSGALYTAGGVVLARYGNVKTEHHVRDVSERMAAFLKDQAGNLPEDCGLFSILKDKKEGAITQAEHFLYRYPSQVTLGVYTLGAAAMLQSGIKHKKWLDAAYGANSTGTKIASILIPEKHKKEGEPEIPPDTMVGKMVNWVQEKPLRVFGYGSMLSAALLGMSAYKEYKHDPKQKSYIFKAVTAGTYMIGDLMMAMSSKDHTNAGGKFDAEEQRRIEGLAAEAIAGQPQAIRGGLAHQVAGFLSMQPEMNGTASDIAAAIGEQVGKMEKNRWACVPKLRPAKPDVQQWQAKLGQAKPGGQEGAPLQR